MAPFLDETSHNNKVKPVGSKGNTLNKLHIKDHEL